MEEIQTDILIVGAGVAGSAMALSLKDSPFTISIVEPRTENHDLNRGDVIYPSTLEIFNKWNVIDIFKKNGALSFTKISAFHGKKEVLTIDISTMNSDFPYALSFDHKDIEETLLHEAITEKVSVFRGYTALNPIFDENNITGFEIVGGGNTKRIKAKLIIGADGRNSKIRSSFGIETHFTEYDKDMVVSWMPLNEEFITGALLFANPPHAIITQILPPGNRLRVAISVPKGKGDEWIKKPIDEKMKYLNTFSSFFTKVKPVFNGEHIYTLNSHHSSLYWKNNCVLIGDAAHVSHPISSQGIGMAVVDAFVLSKIIANDLSNLENKLREYESIRKPSVTKIINHSTLVAKALTNSSLTSKELERFVLFIMEHSSLLRNTLSEAYKHFEYEYMAKPPVSVTE